MQDREFDNYLALLAGLLRLRSKQQAAIAEELRDHLVEHVAHLESQNISHDEAVRRALAEFGDAAALAANFSQLVRNRRRRFLMRCTLGTAFLVAGFTFAIVAMRPELPSAPGRLAAQEPAEGAADSPQAVAKVELISDSNETTRERLERKANIDFSDTPLGDCLEFLAAGGGIQFFLDDRPDNPVNADQTVTLHLQSVPVEMALNLICRRAGLYYRLRHGVVMISTEVDLMDETEVRVYRVPQDAADELAQLIPAAIDVYTWRPQDAPVVGGFVAPVVAGGGGGLGAVEPATAGPPQQPRPRTVGSIQVFRGALVISQTPETHQKIEKLLMDLADVLQGPSAPAGGSASSLGGLPATLPQAR